MAAIVVIAEEELVVAFRLAGADGVAVASREEALVAFRTVTGALSEGVPSREDNLRGSGKAGHAAESVLAEARRCVAGARVLVLSFGVADMLAQEVRDWQLGGLFPLIVEIPGLSDTSPGRKGLTDAIREAIGIAV